MYWLDDICSFQVLCFAGQCDSVPSRAVQCHAGDLFSRGGGWFSGFPSPALEKTVVGIAGLVGLPESGVSKYVRNREVENKDELVVVQAIPGPCLIRTPHLSVSFCRAVRASGFFNLTFGLSLWV